MFVDLYTTLRTENKWSVIYVAIIHDNFINKKSKKLEEKNLSQKEKKYTQSLYSSKYNRIEKKRINKDHNHSKEIVALKNYMHVSAHSKDFATKYFY